MRFSAVLKTWFCLAVLLALAGCERPGGETASRAPAESPSAGGASSGDLDGHEVALKTSGHNSAGELRKASAALGDAATREAFEMAFRYTFSARQAQRNYVEASRLIRTVIKKNPDFAPAYRVLGYAHFNMDPRDPSPALKAYLRAVDLDPDYGEAHYALAFMYAMGDRDSGRKHFQKALELGVRDEKDLKSRFYPDVP